MKRIPTLPKGAGTKKCSYCHTSRNSLSVYPTNVSNDMVCRPCLFLGGPALVQSSASYMIGA